MAEACKQLVLLGGGHAHLALLRRLTTVHPPGWRITLVSPFPRQIYSGMLAGWVAGRYRLDECTISLTVLAARARVVFFEGAVAALDLRRNEVSCADGRTLAFDLLSIDTGSEPASLPCASPHAASVRPIEEFIAAWERIALRWRSAPKTPLELVFVGGGAGAIELAFAADSRARQDGAIVRITLLDEAAAPFDDGNARAGRRLLELMTKRAIVWRGRSRATQVCADRVALQDGTDVPFDACILATGAVAPSWPAQAGLATDEHGFIRVDATLASVSHPHVFAAGDIARYADPRPKSGVFAVRAGPALADNLLATCAGRPRRRWHPQRSALYLIGTADERALATRGSWSAYGRWAWWWKEWIDRRFVEGFQA